MATSRTGTARWKGIVTRRRRQAQRDGVDHCPRCGILLDYTQGRRARNSVEVDHIIPWSQGGPDTYENTMVVCGRCNRKMGDKRTKTQRTPRTRPSIALETTRDW